MMESRNDTTVPTFPIIEAAGADCLLITFNQIPSESTSRNIIVCLSLIKSRLGQYILDAVPGWNTLLLQYDYLRLSYRDIEREVTGVLETWQAKASHSDAMSAENGGRVHLLPVVYDGEDLDEIASKVGMSRQEVIHLHSTSEYFVGAVGFVPGFAYMGGLHEALVLPRRSSPRVAVPKGSVAIAEAQTCVYPEQLPGGWNLIGRCPLRLYDINRQPPGRFKVGDKIRFQQISEAEYQQLEGQWTWCEADGRSVTQ